jgi:hypothetical protein
MGNSAAAGHGRPEGAGKVHLKDMCWETLSTIAWLLFKLPEPEMREWYEANKNTLSRAERAYIEASEHSIEVIESLLDRIVGKTLKCESDAMPRNPLIERLYTLSPENLREEIDQLIRNREIIDKENDSIERGTV